MKPAHSITSNGVEDSASRQTSSQPIIVPLISDSPSSSSSSASQGRSAVAPDPEVSSKPIKSERGFDGGKRVRGRKRHILVDTIGLLLVVVVHAANTQDRLGARRVLGAIKDAFHGLRLIWVDSGYNSKPLQKWLAQLRPDNPVAL